MNNIVFSKDEIKFIEEMISLFVYEHPSIQEVRVDDEDNLYTYDNQGNRVIENFEVSRYKMIQSIEGKLKTFV